MHIVHKWECRITWRPARRRARAFRQALPTTSCVPNVSAVPRSSVARQASNQAITCTFLVHLKPLLQQQSRLVLFLSPPQQPSRAAELAAAPTPAPAEPPLAAPLQQQCGRSALRLAPPVPSAASAVPANVHEEMRSAGNTSARRPFIYLLPPPGGASAYEYVRKPLLSPP